MDINPDSKHLFTQHRVPATLRTRAEGTKVPQATGPLQGARVDAMDEDESFEQAIERAQVAQDNLPVPVGPRAERPSLVRLGPTASFVSQLIAEKHNMQTQRAKRRGSVDSAVDAYATSAAKTVVRMPSGYRKTVIA
jgi:hypothetical protein